MNAGLRPVKIFLQGCQARIYQNCQLEESADKLYHKVDNELSFGCSLTE
jgi:hypothetical protein